MSGIRGTWIFIMAAGSDLPLAEVCEALAARYGLGEFEYASGEEYDVARAGAWGMTFSVARADDPRLVEGWIRGTPPGSNYQITMTAPWDEQGRQAMEGARRFLARLLGAEVTLVTSRQEFRAV